MEVALGYLEYKPTDDKMKNVGFHAGGAATLAQNPEFKRQNRELLEKRLAERAEEFRNAGFWGKQAILRSIHLQINREVSDKLSRCLF